MRGNDRSETRLASGRVFCLLYLPSEPQFCKEHHYLVNRNMYIHTPDWKFSFSVTHFSFPSTITYMMGPHLHVRILLTRIIADQKRYISNEILLMHTTGRRYKYFFKKTNYIWIRDLMWARETVKRVKSAKPETLHSESVWSRHRNSHSIIFKGGRFFPLVQTKSLLQSPLFLC